MVIQFLILEGASSLFQGSWLVFILLCISVAALLITFIVLLLKLHRQSKKYQNLHEELTSGKMEIRRLEQSCQEMQIERKNLDVRIEELKKSKEQISKIAYNDTLTGLPNKNALMDMLESIIQTLRNDETVALLLLDIHAFRDVNVSYGFVHGDELLIDIAHRLQEVLGENDFLARGDSNKFAIVTQNMRFGDEEYVHKLDKLQNIFLEPFLLGTKECYISMNMGITFAPNDGMVTSVLMKNADSALNIAVEKGKNKYYYFEESINQAILKKMELQSELRKAIEENQFVIYYQVRMDLETNHLEGAETILGWNHPERGLLLPDDFIPVAEDCGLIIPINDLMLREVCSTLAKWEKLGLDCRISVKLSAREFKDHELKERFRNILKDYHIVPSHLELELTEKVVMEDVPYARAAIDGLRELGLRITVSGVGTKYVELNYLENLYIDHLKVNHYFIDHMLEDDGDRDIMETLVRIGHRKHCSVMAEGVTQLEQESLLKQMKCNKALGYLYSEPVTKEAAEKLLGAV